jgi:hypothetical protein
LTETDPYRKKQPEQGDRLASRYADVAGNKKKRGLMTYALYTILAECGIGKTVKIDRDSILFVFTRIQYGDIYN